ncbi:MAG: peptide chain release factor N(5)-glutamine methyltransferase [Aeromonadaceae bacterium]|nr:peptide chain release factor N(5)-glutamine methyltransferase [Aeromonadaceae bacterium]
MRLDALRAQLIGRFADSDSAALDADCLLAFVLDKSRTWLRTWPETELSSAQLATVDALAARREQGEPVAHLLGYREFWSLPLKVSKHTLIPRPDTEVLIEQALAHLPASADGWRVLDLGTGTGAIALALKSERPELQVFAVDRVPEACELARENAQDLQLAIEIRQGSWFEPVAGERFSLILSNPPYIDAADPHLQEGDVRFEPASALVAERCGMADLLQIIQQAPIYLLSGGWLLLEHGWQQGEAVREALLAAGFEAVSSVCDYGSNERVSLGQWSGSQR